MTLETIDGKGTGRPMEWEKFSSIYHAFLDVASRRGPHVALRAKRGSTTYNVEITYRDLVETIKIVAQALLEMGVGKGDRTAIASANRPEWVIMDLASLAVGAPDVPLYPTLTGQQMAYILNDSGATVLSVSNEAMLRKIIEIEDDIPQVRHLICFDNVTASTKRIKLWRWNEVLNLGKEKRAFQEPVLHQRIAAASLDDMASIVYTSGTTGEPKGAMLTHRNFLSNAMTCVPIVELKPFYTQLSFLPLSHVFERIFYYAAITLGMTIAYAESIDTVPQNLAEIKPQVVPSVPRLFEKMYARIMEGIEAQSAPAQKVFEWALQIGREYQQLRLAGQPISTVLELQYALAKRTAFKKIHAATGGELRLFCSGGAPLRREIGEFFMAVGIPIAEGYGLTETSPVITLNPLRRPKFGTVGLPIPLVQTKIAADGEIMARGPNIMMGYFNKPQETQECIDPDGWFHTGDIGKFDGEGYLVITDRKKELLVLSNGKNIAPQPIENALKACTAIEQALVIGDNRPFASALIVPNLEALRRFAETQGIAARDLNGLIGEAKIRDFIGADVEAVNASLAQFEKIKKFELIAREFSQDLGELTPTLKLKRKVILATFQAEVEKIYR